MYSKMLRNNPVVVG